MTQVSKVKTQDSDSAEAEPRWFKFLRRQIGIEFIINTNKVVTSGLVRTNIGGHVMHVLYMRDEGQIYIYMPSGLEPSLLLEKGYQTSGR